MTMRALLLAAVVLVALSATLAQDTDPTEPTEGDLEEAVSQEILSNVADAADTVCKAFKPSPDVTARSKRGWWKNTWNNVKEPLINLAVGAVLGNGKRHSLENFQFNRTKFSGWKGWRQNHTRWYNVRDAGQGETTKCDQQLVQKVNSIQDALVVLGTMTDLVTSTQGCAKKPEV
ncbi:uncharacterized protein LOC131930896 [Physella acuta]|uniref:uncharacterized protein LOC131930896 n=1 Tax=Physella acuta TaxID=109671 RepID=UPI0027DD5E6B|nr:uncharacterized protein LOC131930896 [Physella acuta]